jgi:hypothetical protein
MKHFDAYPAPHLGFTAARYQHRSPSRAQP